MKEVTKKEITADTVNAACNCVQNLNLTIKTAIQAAKYLSEKWAKLPELSIANQGALQSKAL